MKDHGQKEKKLDSKNCIIPRSELKSAPHATGDEIKKSRDQYEADGDPGESLKRPASLIQEVDASSRGQGVNRRPKDKQEKGNSPYPEGQRDDVEPQAERLKKAKKSHLSP